MILNGRTYTAEDVLTGIGNCQYVSFDIFDTLVKRCVADPSDVFVRVAEEYNSQNTDLIDVEEFRKIRIKVAKFAAETAIKSGREERTLEDIYEHLASKYGNICQKLLDLEIHCEIECCRPNMIMKEVFDCCIKNGKKILITSDMYLPQRVVETILTKCGFIGYMHLFLSSKLGKKKQTGSMYRHIVDYLGCRHEDIVHVGDNFRIDYVKARQQGLKAVKIPKNTDGSLFKRSGLYGLKSELYNKIQSVIGNFSQKDWSPYYQYGFECIGPMLFGFCTWLHKTAQEKGCKKLFFLSRDGYMMQQAYINIYGIKALPNKYLYASRKSLFGAQVWINPDLKDILKQETPYHYWDVDELCEMLDIDKGIGRKAWIANKLSEKERLIKNEVLNDKRVQSFFECVKPVMVGASRRRFNLVAEYLKQEQFEGDIGIVDVGWAGAIQRYLQRITGYAQIESNVFGFYLGLKPVTVTGPNADAYIPQSEGPSMFCSNLMEYPFTKEEGSTLGYYDHNGIIEPVLQKYEFEGMADQSYTHEMQQGALHFIGLMVSGFGIKELPWTIGYHNVKNVTKRPRLKDVQIFGGLSHENHGKRVFLAHIPNRLDYFRHPKKIKQDFIESGWKIGFLKKLFLLPLPFDNILKLLR